MFSPFTVRINPRLVVLQNDDPEAQMPSNSEELILVGQIKPWRKSKKTKPFTVEGLNQSSEDASQEPFFLDLPFFGRPVNKSEQIIITLLLLTNTTDPSLIATCEFSLENFLLTRRSAKTNFSQTLALVDVNKFFIGRIAFSFCFLSVGTFRVRVLNGSNVKTAASRLNEDQEVYVEGNLNENLHKKKRTGVSQNEDGTNPEWSGQKRQLARKNTLSRIHTLYNLGASMTQSNFGLPKVGAENVLEFKFRNKYWNRDDKFVPRIELALFDKMNTPRKKQALIAAENARMRAVKKKVATVRGEKHDVSQVKQTDKPRGGFLGLFSSKPKKRNASFQEVDITTLSKEEKEMMENLDEATKHLTKNSEQELLEDRYLCSASLDIRPFLLEKPEFSAKIFSLDLQDKNGLSSGSLLCQVEFVNSIKEQLDKSRSLRESVITPPSLEKILNTPPPRNITQAFNILKDVVLLGEVWINEQGLVPQFITQTANETGVSRLNLFLASSLFTVNLMTGFWYGLGLTFTLQALNQVLGIVFPGYQTFKLLEDGRNTQFGDVNSEKQWLSYWVIFVIMYIAEVGLKILNRGNSLGVGYLLGKLLLTYWLVMPKFQGANLAYFVLVGPWLRSYRMDIDRYMSVVGVTGDNLVSQVAQVYDNIQHQQQLGLLELNTSRKTQGKGLGDEIAGIQVYIVKESDYKLNRLGKKKKMMIKKGMSYDDVLLLGSTIVGFSNQDSELDEEFVSEALELLLINKESGLLEVLNNRSIDGIKEQDIVVLKETDVTKLTKRRFSAGRYKSI
eukprot:augustus_masked-scaffold_3-processed-gene-13.53-mRNA-1 protein AED:1.00 eAED:1.00 QI:0/-1/0/0/-1/1/1/0/788